MGDSGPLLSENRHYEPKETFERKPLPIVSLKGNETSLTVDEPVWYNNSTESQA